MAQQHRSSVIDRETRESRIHVELGIDGDGRTDIQTGLGFFDHMLNALGRHGLFDLTVRATGDLDVDAHHTVEDVAIALGRAFSVALGSRAGITRIASAYAPLDEALARVVVDAGGRGYAVVDATFRHGRIGDLDSDLFRHFVETLAIEGRLNIHATILAGENDHHRAEALIKALARALDAATRLDPRLGDSVPSTKGVIDVG